MSSESLAESLSTVEPKNYVVISGYPDDGTSAWHVNKAIQMGDGSGATRIAIVLQSADASEHWLTAILSETGTDVTFEEFTAFEGQKPTGMSAGEHGEEINHSEIEFIEESESAP